MIIIIVLVIIDFKFTPNKINNIENNKTEKINNIENNKLKFIIDKIKNIGKAVFSSNLKSYNRFFDNKIYKSLMNKGIKKYFNKNIRIFELLYQASIDGFGRINFHKKCDGKKNTIVLVITDNNRIFGGFTELEWDSYSGYKEGNKGFIFSINDNKIYYNKSKYKIDCESYLQARFKGGFSIHSINNENYGQDFIINGEFDTEGKEYALAGKFYFKIKDYLVFQIYLEE